jgi:hypothetical protein
LRSIRPFCGCPCLTYSLRSIATGKLPPCAQASAGSLEKLQMMGAESVVGRDLRHQAFIASNRCQVWGRGSANPWGCKEY